ncbi:glycosyltransferase [Sphingomonas sp. AOB5]|uniref:glycosyltransferase n=1 Tax=Sphingomonas sp. AOB5 TaxID=3034017 RepID=UPI0023F808B6|nr:glycosyltransferase [Sphingomonas sp. AOB5]MDF7775444.1 glycosyltransferase [Sphingomonas sp. AOB5]
MKLFLAGASFDPSFGGPAYSVPALGAALAARGVTVGLWAADGSAPHSATVPAIDGLTPLDGDLQSALGRFGRPDVIHDNGIWLPSNHQVARLARARSIPRVVSLRGMLEPWAINHRKWKKKLAWTLYQRGDLRSAALLHATADIEETNARALGLKGPFCVIANGVDLPAHSAAEHLAPAPRDRRTALFVSRIHPKKGLPMLLDAWSRLKPEGWQLVIAGPDEDGHAALLSAQIERLGLGGDVRLIGPVYGAEKDALYQAADLFVLPTYSENFGIAIAEALAYEVPVLTTRGAPWELLETYGCGWWVDPTEEAILSGLRAAIGLSDEARRDMGRRGSAMVAERFDWGGIAMQFQRQYEALLG